MTHTLDFQSVGTQYEDEMIPSNRIVLIIEQVQASPNGGSTKAAFESFARSIARSQYL